MTPADSVGRSRTASDLFENDDKKLQSCATAFAQVSAAGSPFHRLLDQYFEGLTTAMTRRSPLLRRWKTTGCRILIKVRGRQAVECPPQRRPPLDVTEGKN